LLLIFCVKIAKFELILTDSLKVASFAPHILTMILVYVSANDGKDINIGFHNINQVSKWLVTATAVDGTGLAFNNLTLSNTHTSDKCI